MPRVCSKGWRCTACRPIVRPPLPAVRDAAWVRNPIDRFVLARLEKENVRLKKIVAELELDRSILKEALEGKY